MPLLNKIKERFERERPFSRLRVGISIHLEAKTACLARAFQAGGAEVALTGSNPLSTQDDVGRGLSRGGDRSLRPSTVSPWRSMSGTSTSSWTRGRT
jgi:adenosylhomocysteinase